MTTFETGRKAETAAADYLALRGYRILEQNWRTRYCEIDIVASKSKIIYFFEVKYRKTAAWGGGLDYIGPKKLRQMGFAAEMWASQNKWRGDYSLGAVEVSGSGFDVTNLLEQID